MTSQPPLTQPDLKQLGPRPPFASGLCTPHELRLLGIDDRRAARLIAAGELVRLRRGCFATREAAMLPDAFHSRDAADVVKTERSLANSTIVDGLPTLPIADTVVDCLRVLDFEPAMIVCESALWRGVPRDVLEAAIERAARRRGVGRARAVLSAASALSESAAETRARLLLLALALSAGQPVQQFWVTLGGRRFRLDYAWPDLLVALEIDGRSKYLGRTPTSDVLLAERGRENALTNAGWIVVRITWSDLNHPERVEAMLVRAFERAGRMCAA